MCPPAYHLPNRRIKMQMDQERKKAMMDELKHFIRAEIKAAMDAYLPKEQKPVKAKRETATKG